MAPDAQSAPPSRRGQRLSPSAPPAHRRVQLTSPSPPTVNKLAHANVQLHEEIARLQAQLAESSMKAALLAAKLQTSQAAVARASSAAEMLRASLEVAQEDRAAMRLLLEAAQDQTRRQVLALQVRLMPPHDAPAAHSLARRTSARLSRSAPSGAGPRRRPGTRLRWRRWPERTDTSAAPCSWRQTPFCSGTHRRTGPGPRPPPRAPRPPPRSPPRRRCRTKPRCACSGWMLTRSCARVRLKPTLPPRSPLRRRCPWRARCGRPKTSR